MRRTLIAACVILSGGLALAADWHAQKIPAPARVMEIDASDGALINAGNLWYRFSWRADKPALTFVDDAPAPELPENALPHGRVVAGKHDIVRTWLADPTQRYAHGILGDKTTAQSLSIEMRDGKMHTVRLKDDAVFEDLTPRLADLDGDGRDEIVVVKSYLTRGSALAVIGRRDGKYEVLAETPPLGGPNRWLNPAGIADFNGDGKTDIALVRQPHVVGELELWTWRDGKLSKTASLGDAANHFIGSRALGMSVVADFDDDGIADLAIPALDRDRLRFVSFVPQAHELASIALPAKAATDFALVMTDRGPAVLAGLNDGSLLLARRSP
jgi:hypothetical protein